jgi:hypothetical protein
MWLPIGYISVCMWLRFPCIFISKYTNNWNETGRPTDWYFRLVSSILSYVFHVSLLTRSDTRCRLKTAALDTTYKKYLSLQYPYRELFILRLTSNKQMLFHNSPILFSSAPNPPLLCPPTPSFWHAFHCLFSLSSVSTPSLTLILISDQ